MQALAIKNLNRVDFRQNYIPKPLPVQAVDHGHWLLSDVLGRDLLKIKLLTVERQSKVLLWAEGRDFDPKLDPMIDALGLRELAKPTSQLEMLQTAWLLVKVMAVATFELILFR